MNKCFPNLNGRLANDDYPILTYEIKSCKNSVSTGCPRASRRSRRDESESTPACSETTTTFSTSDVFEEMLDTWRVTRQREWPMIANNNVRNFISLSSMTYTNSPSGTEDRWPCWSNSQSPSLLLGRQVSNNVLGQVVSEVDTSLPVEFLTS